MIVAVPVELAVAAVWLIAVVLVVVREVRAYRRDRSAAAARAHLAEQTVARGLALDLSDVVWRWPA